MSVKYLKPDGQVVTLEKELSKDEVLRRGYVLFIPEKKRNCGHCKWWVNENPKKVGDFDHKFAVTFQKGFCLLQDLFTYTESNQKACEDSLII